MLSQTMGMVTEVAQSFLTQEVGVRLLDEPKIEANTVYLASIFNKLTYLPLFNI
jgi:hypothetical protein